jgi:hypothetical protein
MRKTLDDDESVSEIEGEPKRNGIVEEIESGKGSASVIVRGIATASDTLSVNVAIETVMAIETGSAIGPGIEASSIYPLLLMDRRELYSISSVLASYILMNGFIYSFKFLPSPSSAPRRIDPVECQAPRDANRFMQPNFK